MTRAHYFAFGSNMLSARLLARTDSALPRGLVRLPGWRLAFHKRGADGSGKCDIYPGSPGDYVLGVIYDIAAGQLPDLDRFEGSGYRRTLIDVTYGDRVLPCATYRAVEGFIDPSLRPFDWYHRLVVTGLIEHGADAGYLDSVRGMHCISDPDVRRPERRQALAALARFSEHVMQR